MGEVLAQFPGAKAAYTERLQFLQGALAYGITIMHRPTRTYERNLLLLNPKSEPIVVA